MMSAEMEADYDKGLKTALDAGYAVLQGGGASLDAVVAAITELENNPIFNAGRGSVFTKKGLHEMDAMVMNGKDLSAGAVAGVRNIKNPIKL
jgi:beta-aspartyl-peptidase (threonine type)